MAFGSNLSLFACPLDREVASLPLGFTFGSAFVSVAGELKNPQLRRFSVGGLRAGAATGDCLRAHNMARTRWRGRWASDAVPKHYLQRGTCHMSASAFQLGPPQP